MYTINTLLKLARSTVLPPIALHYHNHIVSDIYFKHSAMHNNTKRLILISKIVANFSDFPPFDA